VALQTRMGSDDALQRYGNLNFSKVPALFARLFDDCDLRCMSTVDCDGLIELILYQD